MGTWGSKIPTNASLICPHAVRYSLIIHGQISILYKCTFQFCLSLICSFHQSLSWSRLPWQPFISNKLHLQLCFVKGFKSVASLLCCQHFDVTHHFAKQTSICFSPGTSEASKNKGTAEFRPVVERHQAPRYEHHKYESSMSYEIMW